MMSWPDASLSISGTVDAEDDLDLLAKAIVADAPTVDWGGTRIRDVEVARDLIREAAEEGRPLVFAENGREDSDFPLMQAACRRIGLSYCLSVDVDEDDSVPGSTEIWTPGIDAPRTFIGSCHAGGVLLKPQDLLPLLESGDFEELGRIVRTAAAPEADLPTSLALGPGLSIEPAASPAPSN